MRFTVPGFFRDKQGNTAIVQKPNVLLYIWAVSSIGAHFLQGQSGHNGLSSLASASLFAWAYLELTKGASHFRQLLGSVILALITIHFFSR